MTLASVSTPRDHMEFEPSLGSIDVFRASDLADSDYPRISQRLHEISASDPAILERSADFYLSQLRNNRIFLAFHDGEIVGMVGFIPLSPRRSEISGAWVDLRYRDHKIYIHLRTLLHQEAASQGQILLATNKPHIATNIGAGMTNAHFGLLPSPFWWLAENDPEAFRECCCCKPGEKDHNACPERDKTCFLFMEGVPGEVSDIVTNSPQWQDISLVLQERVRFSRRRVRNLVAV